MNVGDADTAREDLVELGLVQELEFTKNETSKQMKKECF